MASTAAQNIDTWLRQPYTDADYLSYTRNQDNTESQQHPGNGVVLDRANTVVRHSVAKTQKSYNIDGVMAIRGSLVNSETPNMRTAYPGYDMDVDQGSAPELSCWQKPANYRRTYRPLRGQLFYMATPLLMTPRPNSPQ